MGQGEFMCQRAIKTPSPNEQERAESDGDKHAILVPSSHLAEKLVSAGVCTLPAAMQVGCQASSGRYPSATLDESERAYAIVAEDDTVGW